MMIQVLFSFTLSSLAQAPDSSSKSIDSTTSGYSNGGVIALIILILIFVGLMMAFTWRKKKLE